MLKVLLWDFKWGTIGYTNDVNKYKKMGGKHAIKRNLYYIIINLCILYIYDFSIFLKINSVINHRTCKYILINCIKNPKKDKLIRIPINSFFIINLGPFILFNFLNSNTYYYYLLNLIIVTFFK